MWTLEGKMMFIWVALVHCNSQTLSEAFSVLFARNRLLNKSLLTWKKVKILFSVTLQLLACNTSASCWIRLNQRWQTCRACPPSIPILHPFTTHLPPPQTSTHLSKGQTLRLTSTVVWTRMTSTCQSLLVREGVGCRERLYRVLQGANSTASGVSEHEVSGRCRRGWRVKLGSDVVDEDGE